MAHALGLDDDFQAESQALARWESEQLTKSRTVRASDRLRFPATEAGHRMRLLAPATGAPMQGLSITEALFHLMKLHHKKKLRLKETLEFAEFENALEKKVLETSEAAPNAEADADGGPRTEDRSTGRLVAQFRCQFGVDVRVFPGNQMYSQPLEFGTGEDGSPVVSVGHLYETIYVPLDGVISNEEADADLQGRCRPLLELTESLIRQRRRSPTPPSGPARPELHEGSVDSEKAELNRILDLLDGAQEYDDSCEPPKENVNLKMREKLKQDPQKFRLCRLSEPRNRGGQRTASPTEEQPDGLTEVRLDSAAATWKTGEVVVVEVTGWVNRPQTATGKIVGRYHRPDRYGQFLPKQELQRLLSEQPGRFKRCSLELGGPQSGRAVPLDPNDSVTRVQLNGRQNCGRACQGDEVVAEVMGQDKVTKEFKGRVVGVLKQAEKLRHQLFMCEVLTDPGTLMKPLCGSFPKIGYDNGPAVERAQQLLGRHEGHEARVESGQEHVGGRETDRERVNREFVSVFSPQRDQSGGVHLKFQRIQRVNKEFCDQVFLVCFEYWHLDQNYPFGKVVHVLESLSADPTEAFELIQMRHRLPRPLTETTDVRKQVAGITAAVKNPRKGREDLRCVPTVTIDNPDTKDMDDAISYTRDPETNVETVGVHITDVCEFLPQGSHIDKLARARLRTVYPPRTQHGGATSGRVELRPNHMLPSSLSENSLSLKEGEDRLCLSVMFSFTRDTQGRLKKLPIKFRQTVIRSDLRLNKEDVQPLLLEPERDPATFGRIPEDIVRMLRALWDIAKRLRLERLGEAGFLLQNDDCEDQDGEGIGRTFETACLIEELMVLANLSVGKWLESKRQPSVVRVQDRPRPAEVDQWLSRYHQVLVHSPRLQRDLRSLKRSFTLADFPLSLTRADYQFISKFYRTKPRDCVLRIMSDSRQPHMLLALTEWFGVCQVAGYAPTQLRPQQQEQQQQHRSLYHFSLQESFYAHFTSPMRRYADIVVHRAFKAALKGETASAPNLDDLCDALSRQDRRARRFEKDSASYEFATRLKRRPQRELVVVRSLEEAEVAFTNPHLRRLPKAVGALKMSSFGLDARPLSDSKENTMRLTLHWSRRIYVHPACEDRERFLTRIQHNFGSDVRVRRDAYVQRVLCGPVRQLRNRFIQSGADYAAVRADFQGLQEVLQEDKGAWTVTCETDVVADNLLVSGTPVKFYRDLSVGDLLQVQFRATLRQGLLTPAVSLIEVCATHSVCVSHREDPVRCFAEVTNVKSKPSYRSIGEYAEIWQRILAIESASVATRSDDSVILHEVPLDWRFHRPSNRWLGVFHLPAEFCLQRQIKVGPDVTVVDPELESKIEELQDQRGRGGGRSLTEDALMEAFELAGERTRFSDFLCLRFPGTEMSEQSGKEGHTEVAHGGVLLVYQTAHGRSPCCSGGSHSCQLVVFTLQQHDLPCHFDWSKVLYGTVEVLQKFLPIRRQELALWKLPRLQPNSLAQRVALLGSSAYRLENNSYGQKLKEKKVQSFSIAVGSEERDNEFTNETSRRVRRIPCNEVQNRAITEAMKYDLTLIWGPPGTGKTSTGVMLTYWFVFVNRCFDEEANLDDSENGGDDGDSDNGDDREVEGEMPVEDVGTEKAFIDYSAFEANPVGWDGLGEALRDSQQDDAASWNTVGPKGRRVAKDRRSGSLASAPSARTPVRRTQQSRTPVGATTRALFVDREEDLQKRRQVLYCGPSNRSVDVVAEYLQSKLGPKCPKLVRVFSEQLELRRFPVPGDGGLGARLGRDADPTPGMEAISLHVLIRDPAMNPRLAALLLAFDELFKKFLAEQFKNLSAWRRCLVAVAQADAGFQKFLQRLALDMRGPGRENVGPMDLELLHLVTLYKKIVTKSKKLVLQKFEVVLCTTSVSCSSVLQSACKFAQIILDEAGMCTEPETLVPLVGFLGADPARASHGAPQRSAASHFAERLVLIGDHKQLSPIIENRTAEQLGLGTSLFERHSHRAIMLSLQYRMHPSLAEFSADYFYRTSDAHLQTRESPTWTGLNKGDDILWAGEDISPWNGINTHQFAKGHVYDSFDFRNNRKVTGKLRHENANVLFGCWPGIRKSQDFSDNQFVYSSHRLVRRRDLHPMGEEDRIVFLHVEGVEERVTVTTELGSEESKRNEQEIQEVVRVYKAIRDRAERPRIFSESLAVLSQYKYQVTSIAERIQTELHVRSPIVKTVIASQGSEYDYVILSLVRSLPDYEIPKFPLPSWEAKNLGFITDANQINVALTRARKGLIIIGNQKLLRANPMWSQLITHLRTGNCVVDSRGEFPDRTGDKRFSTSDGRDPTMAHGRLRGAREGNAWQGNPSGRFQQQQQQQHYMPERQQRQPQPLREQQQQQQQQQPRASHGPPTRSAAPHDGEIGFVLHQDDFPSLR